MGLDLSCGVNFSYGNFADFREAIAKQIGVDLSEMKGFGGTRSFTEIKDDVKYLLDHSDCDGQISAKKCGKIAIRLREIAEAWNTDVEAENEDSDDEDYEEYDNYKYYREKAIDLADGMETCCLSNIPLYFR